MNLSQQRREESIKRIKEIRDFISHSAQDENAGRLLTYLSELEKEIKGKKYGLVFEEHREKIDETLEKNAPVLTEQEDLYIDNGGQMNFLIEGDNLAALELLLKTHRGKIDLIYIDPPYNTGNKDFIYDDDYVDKNDTFRHSKWISFMEKRLMLAKCLLKQGGLLFISIDDNEQSQLILLCNEILGEENCIAILPTIMNLKGNQDQFGFAGAHEYTLVFTNNVKKATVGMFPIEEEDLGEWQIDSIGYYKKGANLKATGTNAPSKKRPNLYYPIYIERDGSISVDSQTETSFVVYPITNGEKMSWRWSKEKVRNESYNLIVEINGKQQISIYKKQRPAIGDLPSKKPKSIFYRPEYSSGNGTAQLSSLFGYKIFANPKPLELIMDFIRLSNSTVTVLDFFAGSGTTGHAVLKLNAEDGGTRRFILCTNNENNICRDITYERIKRVIDKEDYAASLKYFKIDFVRISERLYYEYADELLLHIRELVELENGVNFRNNSEIAIVLTDEELDAFMENRSALKDCKALYVGHDVLINGRQSAALKRRKIAVNVIPQYYYEES